MMTSAEKAHKIALAESHLADARAAWRAACTQLARDAVALDACALRDRERRIADLFTAVGNRVRALASMRGRKAAP